MDGTGRAHIADFGLATITQHFDSIRAVSIQRGNTLRWIAPEVLSGGRHSKEADVFSLAMVMIEVRRRQPTRYGVLTCWLCAQSQVFTDTVPFGDDPPVSAMLAITRGRRPHRPTHIAFTEELWLLMQRCWDHNPHSRPEMLEVSQALSK